MKINSKIKPFLTALGFSPQENSADIFVKKYDGTKISVNFSARKIDFGNIKSESKTTQNFSQPENFVVLECVDRLLEKGYSPADIILEKSYPGGRGIMKRLDILVLKNKKAFLMIECKI
jgi:type I restriction enzyme M protein